MFRYIYSARLSSGPDPRSCSTQRAGYARGAVYAEFPFKHARALDYGGFVDRRPNQTPRPAPEAWRRETRTQRSWGQVT